MGLRSDSVVANPCVEMMSEALILDYALVIREENIHWQNNLVIQYIQVLTSFFGHIT